MRFSRLYEELKFDDVFKKTTPDEMEKRHKEFLNMKISKLLEHLSKTKLLDGSWHIHENLDLQIPDFTNAYCNFSKLNVSQDLTILNISIIDGSFSCSFCNLTSLKGGPKEVKYNYNCQFNQLKTLLGAPIKVGGDFYCYNNAVKFTESDVKELCEIKGKIKT